MAAGSLTEARSIIETALKDLEGEARSLERALAALGDRQPPASTSPTERKRRPRKRAKPGQRRAEFLEVLGGQPGVTVAQAAKKLGVKPPNALYALAKQLIAEGKVIKRGTGYALKNDPAKGSNPGKSKPRRRLKAKRARASGAKSRASTTKK